MKLDLLKKLFSMSQHGTPEEAAIAKTKLDGLLEKHGMSLSDIGDEETAVYFFSYQTAYERKLIEQLAAAITNNIPRMYKKTTERRTVKVIGLLLTKSQNADFSRHYDIYRKDLKIAFKEAYHAFLVANNIFSESPLEIKEADNTEKDEAYLSLVNRLARGIKRSTVLNQIEGS